MPYIRLPCFNPNKPLGTSLNLKTQGNLSQTTFCSKHKVLSSALVRKEPRIMCL